MKKILYALILMLIAYVPLSAQTVEDTIGHGTTTTGLYYSLLYRYSASTTSNYSKNTIMYTQAELAARNILPGNTITAIAFEKTTTAVLTNGATAVLTIGVKDGGAANAYPTGANIYTYTATGFTTVATINYNTTSNNFPAVAGWVYFTFSTPFVYTGGDLEFYGDWVLTPNAGNPTDGAFSWRYHSTSPDYRTLFTYSSSSAPGSNYRYNNRGNIIIVHTSSTAPTGCTGTPAHATISGPASPICAGTSTSLSATGFATGTGISYKWQVSPPAVNTWTDYPGATTTSINPTLPSSVDFRMVTMCSGSGLADTSNVITVTVSPLPVAGSITQVNAGLAYTFTAVGVQNATSDMWIYGDGNFGTSNAHTYSTAGTYTVRHAVSNACGNDTATLVINVAAPLCSGTPNHVTVTGPATACENAVFAVTAAGQSTGNGITYQWQYQPVGTSTFIDVPSPGGTGTSLNYVSSVDVELRLITTCSGSGLTDTSNISLTTIDSLPVAGNITQSTVGNTVTFTANSVAHAASQMWHYGDGTNDASGVHTYLSNGNYNVMFIATNPCGSDTARYAITIGSQGVSNVNGLADLVNLYPNPASDNINIVGTGDIKFDELTILSSTGAVVIHRKVEQTATVSQPVTTLASGIYILQLHTPQGVVHKQFTISR